MNCYDLALDLIVVLGEIDSAIDAKARMSSIDARNRADKDIDRLEARMFEIKKILKSKEV